MLVCIFPAMISLSFYRDMKVVSIADKKRLNPLHDNKKQTPYLQIKKYIHFIGYKIGF